MGKGAGVEEPDDDAAGYRVRRTTGLTQKFQALIRLIVDREAVIVTLMAVSVALSAFSVWQATRASDEADERGDRVRVAETQALRLSSAFQTMVDHDINVLGAYCTALYERDIALVDVFGEGPNVAGVVAGDLTMRALKPLLRADSPAEPCSDPGLSTDDNPVGYSVARARQTRLDLGPGTGFGSFVDAESTSSLSRTERRLMAAGVAFAVSLFGLILIDALGDRIKRPTRWQDRTMQRGQRWSVVLVVASIAVGAVILALESDGVSLVIALGIVVVLAFAGRKLGRDKQEDAGGPTPLGGTRGTPHWWAEVLGALTLVAFALAALGLSYVTTLERDERAQSERQHMVAQRLLQAGEQAALRDLATVAHLAILDARVAAANQAGSSDEAANVAGMRDAIAERLQANELSIREEFSILLGGEDEEDCPFTPFDVPEEPGNMLEEGVDRPAVFAEHIGSHSAAASACNVLSAATRNAATRWAARASMFTVALVILGLAGLLFALAADPDRARGSSRWLLWVGAGGAALGILAGALVPLHAIRSGTEPLGRAELLEFSKEVAAGHHDECHSALDSLNRAMERSENYGPALAERAFARFCASAPSAAWPAMTSDLEDDAIPLILDDLTTALDLGPGDPTVMADLGWAHILNGLHGGSEATSELREGLRMSLLAIEALEASSSSAVPLVVHIVRFNVALAHAALDDTDTAMRAYARAVECLDPDPATDCPGGGLIDPKMRAERALWALADLELVESEPEATDPYREVILRGFSPGVGESVPWNGAELRVFPQAVQIAGGAGSPPLSSVVWYYRPDGEMPWGVLIAPSLLTLSDGPHLARRIAADELLPAGEYRADIYSGGRKTASLPAPGGVADGFARRTSRQLGLSVVVPSDWTGGDEVEGVDWSFHSSQSSRVAFKRVEGVEPDSTMEVFLAAQLDTWLAERFDRDVAGEEHETRDDNFLGLDETVVRRYDDLNVTAAAAFSSYASSPWCPGAVIMALVDDTALSTEVADTVLDSIALTASPMKLPPHDGTFESEVFTLDIPAGWDSAPRPPGGTGDAFSAKDCATGTNVLVNYEPLDGRTVNGYVKQTLEDFESDPTFDEFDLQDRHALEVPGTTAATEIVYTWLSDNGPVLQRQVYATDGRNLLYMTFTTHADDASYYAEAADLLVNSLRLREE